MNLDPFIILYELVVLFTYGSVTIICIIFTFFNETYQRLDEQLNLAFLSRRIITPLERNIQTFDDWLIVHHRTIGPVLIFLSLLDFFLLARMAFIISMPF